MLAIGCVLAALAAISLAPAFAGAQAAEDEYNLTLPGANGGDRGKTDASGGQGQGQGVSASSGGSEGGGGAPIVLIGLAAVAAVCAGAAIWRLRERAGQRPGQVGPGAPEAASETQ